MLVRHLEERGACSGGIESTELPGASVSYSDLNLRDTLILLVRGDGGTNTATNLDLSGALNVKGGIEGHLKLSFCVLGEDSLVCLLKESRVE